MTHDVTPVTAAQFEQLLQTALQPMKEDIDFLKENMATKEDMQGLEKDLGEMRLEMATKDEMRALQKTLDSDRLLADKRFAWLREGIDQTLIVLGNVEKKLEGKIVGHESRIKRLEKKAGLAQTVA